ncbi:MAG: hypothetical protein CO090_03805 [Acidobacteria bacterium CG_4_9_14_3_um_filter_49_7]|nr:MAG: hypothetical protein CO090_03805 [Acidobacteria bacterium CG_4_9_14_3_um_filter_49_7]
MKNLFIGLIFLAVGIGLAWWGKGMLNDAKASKSWPSVQGTVMESTLTSYKSTSGSGSKKRSTTMYKPQITYRYKIAGKEHVGDKVTMSDGGSSSTSYAKKTIKKYPAGATVKVFYDPEVPADSVLEPGATLVSYVPFWFGLVFAIIGGFTFLGGIFRVIRKIFMLGVS